MRRSLSALASLAVALTGTFLSGAAYATYVAGSTDRPTVGDIRTVKRLGGIPPCREEDGSGQVGACYWNDGTGDAVVLVPVGPNRDKRAVILVNR